MFRISNMIIASVVILTVGAFIFPATIGCNRSEDGADQIQAERMDELMSEAIAEIGDLPSITNFKELKDAKMIAELRDQEDLVCYAYTYSFYDGKYHYQGKCLGYGLPYSVQMTNPKKPFSERVEVGSAWTEKHAIVKGLKPQPEPNGLFMPPGLSATWVMMLDPSTGDPHPVYMEPELSVSPFPLPYAVYPDGVSYEDLAD